MHLANRSNHLKNNLFNSSSAVNQIVSPNYFNKKDIWNEEYGHKPTIPSSHRAEPSHALVELFNRNKIFGEDALDLGCGNGRNSFFLAEKGFRINSLDYSEVALKLLKQKREVLSKSRNINIVNHDINLGLPFNDSSFDLVLDSYCLCHFINFNDYMKAMDECLRVLRPKGMFIKIHLDDKDEYYLERIHERTGFGHVSLDRVNGIKKLHIDLDTYNNNFANGFNCINSFNHQYIDDVRGKEYTRTVFVSLMEKI
jgi:ubiquinone/menaquinone biosynthesis C-methylase UbiE